jgi:hypothetical protein
LSSEAADSRYDPRNPTKVDLGNPTKVVGNPTKVDLDIALPRLTCRQSHQG